MTFKYTDGFWDFNHNVRGLKCAEESGAISPILTASITYLLLHQAGVELPHSQTAGGMWGECLCPHVCDFCFIAGTDFNCITQYSVSSGPGLMPVTGMNVV